LLVVFGGAGAWSSAQVKVSALHNILTLKELVSQSAALNSLAEQLAGHVSKYKASSPVE
jgi:hypothetical protein